MPRLRPKYRRHSTGLAFVEIAGKRIYLKQHGTAESLELYNRLLAEIAAGQPPSTSRARHGTAAAADSRLSVNELILRFWEHAERYYVRIEPTTDGELEADQARERPAGGSPSRPENTRQLENFRPLVRGLAKLYGHLPVDEFGPLKLKAFRQVLIDSADTIHDTPVCSRHKCDCQAGRDDGVHVVFTCPTDGCGFTARIKRRLSRRYINGMVARVRQIFAWGVSEELVPPSVLHGLNAVKGLRAGYTVARETSPVKPVPLDWVSAVLPYVSPQVRAMIEIQRLTGMRSDNVTAMRACDIDMGGPVWTYSPPQHKGKHLGNRLRIAIGPKAQAIIREFLSTNLEAYLFSAAASRSWHYENRRASRKSKVTPSQAKRRPKRNPKSAPGARFSTASYRRAIVRGIEKARAAGVDVPHWHPHQLRHRLETDVRRQFGLEAAQVVAGHKNARITELYAETNFETAQRVAREIG